MLPYPTYACQQCGLSLQHHLQTLCGQCLTRPPAFSRCLSAFDYAPPVSQLITACKFQQRVDYAYALSQCFVEQVSPVLNQLAQRPTYLIPIPLHRKRLLQRGFNVADIIARRISQPLNIPILQGAITRIKHTVPQAGLGQAKRRSNLRGAFHCSHALTAESVAIVDDVITTGTTCHEMARTLQRAGVKDVWVFCLARAQKRF